MTANPNIMSVRRAAQITGKDEQTIRRWYRKGAIARWVDPGGTVFVDVRECLPREDPTAPEGSHVITCDHLGSDVIKR